VDLARLFADGRRGGVDQDWMQDPATSDDDLHEALLELPGIGPYAAANIMQLMGRYARLPLDTESVRHGRAILKYKGSDAQVMKKVHAHYQPFGTHAFRSYWFEMWEFYESKRGPSHTWERETTGRTFTAAQF
jgi:3-methyladenine DNA glycosylase/8-oxoguanine DNA glycosylase